jgi:hypothetical protein
MMRKGRVRPNLDRLNTIRQQGVAPARFKKLLMASAEFCRLIADANEDRRKSTTPAADPAPSRDTETKPAGYTPSHAGRTTSPAPNDGLYFI